MKLAPRFIAVRRRADAAFKVQRTRREPPISPKTVIDADENRGQCSAIARHIRDARTKQLGKET
ncbi:hypothetical protein ASD02_07540 [Ensifer sp. Root1252]|nr:hypothetical protein ASD00_06820 [Ensifer sp. Root31]KQW58810.1 hypothetical protein ASD02_07540 [Ensifer sp. Root1252]KQW74516.1 hypothetical protein ASD03_08180 [Ensifer sp. Root127]KQY62076.1 hypothetical protein ASD52_15690 [Ensifer sp. Root142]KRC67647.1 hypothetical protein ASE32_11000 [Ensifer sp. Root231]KRC98723.1 hypothetical protein ASE47_06190 [Ensifer sp. Root258]OMQ46226.1 hypothetical protein BKP54_04235 [Ensifer sp. 1H6]PSS63010.1 hypothetical protein C6558_19185 [Ensifer 